MDRLEVEQWLNAHDVKAVRVEGVNHDGVSLGKHLSVSKFLGCLDDGSAVSDLAFGFDLGGTPYLGWWDDWRLDGLGDTWQVPDPSTLAMVPNRPGVAMALADYRLHGGIEHPVCPRSMLRRVVDEMAVGGLRGQASFELEFIAFEETYATARRRDYQGLTAVGLPTPLPYLTYNAHRQARLMDEVMRRCEVIALPCEGWNNEAAPGQIEMNFPPTDPVGAADRLMRARSLIRETAVDLGMCVTFMAKPGPDYGNGLHVHHSVWRDGANLMADAAARGSWLAGIMATLDACIAVVAPTVNSYRRFAAFSAAPTHPRWGDDDKSAAVRVLANGAPSARIEYRVAAGDANPYYVLAVVLASGLYGLQSRLDAPPRTNGSGWALPASFPRLASTLSMAVERFRDEPLMAKLLGEPFCSFWVNSRSWENLMFHTSGGDALATVTTLWELRRYFEIVG